MKKFKLLKKAFDYKGNKLYQIQALRDIPMYGIKAGDIGGFVEHESNLSQEGNSWITHQAKVYGNSYVEGNAYIAGFSKIKNNSYISGETKVLQYALIDNSVVKGSCCIKGKSFIKNSIIERAISIEGYSTIKNSTLSGNGSIYAEIYHSHISSNLKLSINETILSRIDLFANNIFLDGKSRAEHCSISTKGDIVIHGDCLLSGEDNVKKVDTLVCESLQLNDYASLLCKGNRSFEHCQIKVVDFGELTLTNDRLFQHNILVKGDNLVAI